MIHWWLGFLFAPGLTAKPFRAVDERRYTVRMGRTGRKYDAGGGQEKAIHESPVPSCHPFALWWDWGRHQKGVFPTNLMKFCCVKFVLNIE